MRYAVVILLLASACTGGRSRVETAPEGYPLSVTRDGSYPPSVTELAGPALPAEITDSTDPVRPLPRRSSPDPIGADNLAYVPEAAESPARAASLKLAQDGRLAWLNGETHEARQKLQSALQIWGGNPYAHYYLGLVEFRSGRYSQAARFARAAIRGLGHVDFWNARAHLLLARAEEKRGNMKEAFQARTQASELDPRVELR